MKIITTLRDRQENDEPDPLLEILSGRQRDAAPNSRTQNTENNRFDCSRQRKNASDKEFSQEQIDTR